MEKKNEENPGKITQLREALFDQIVRLNNPSLDLDQELKRAHAITSVGTVIVNSVKVEIDYARVSRREEEKKKPGKLLEHGK
jgi:hypothetical protein